MATPMPMVDPGLLRAIHYILLARFGNEETYRFWRQYPYETDGQTLDPVAIARLLEDDQRRISMRWAAQVMNGLEPFLNERGTSIKEIAENLLPRVNGGSFISAQTILGTLVPFLVRLSRLSDPHRLLIRMFTFGTSRITPGVLFDEVAVLPGAGSPAPNETLLLVGLPALWDGAFEPIDGEIFIADLFRMMPRALGLAPFVEVAVVADARPAPAIAHGCQLELRGDAVFLDGARIGSVQPFSAFCQQRRLRLKSHGQPDSLVLVAERDWHCPRRRRVVLHEGCAYGAPVYLLRARWSPQRERIHNVFEHLVEEAMRSEPDPASRELAERFITSHERVIHCVFDAADNSFYADERLVCRGVPALILRNSVRGRIAGRSQFTFREFKRDREIVAHPKNTGFEVRLGRLRNTLLEAHCGLRIEPAGRGRFTLIADGRVSLSEQSSAPGREGAQPSDPSGEFLS
ncbi:MAG TPA: hypothetical protein VJV78_26725 [Polyangiales bacterium]|nr:hypothetical protein [Polyangiales bacterium]